MTTISIYAPGHFDPYDSYGLIACELLRHLDALGVRVNALSLGYHQRGNQPPDIARLTRRPIQPSFGGILLGYPTGYANHGALSSVGQRVALTMFESSKIPGAWVEILNEMNAVIVPSAFCAETFAACGVDASLISVIPLGISDAYQPVKRDRQRPLTFLAFMDRGARKGGHAAIQAFMLAFGERQDVRLVLKMRETKRPFAITNENIEVIQQDMTEAELADLYGRCDVLINANKGEGFGLIPREFACTGGVSLATAWGGTVDDLPLWGHPLPFGLVPADWKGNKILEGQDLGVWAEPRIEEIAEILLHVEENRDSYQDWALLNAPNVSQFYSWRRFATSILGIWEGLTHGNHNPAHAVLA